MRLCKHRINLIAGRSDDVVSDNIHDVRSVSAMFKGTLVLRTFKRYLDAVSDPSTPFRAVKRLRERLNTEIHGLHLAPDGPKPIYASVRNMNTTAEQREREKPMRTREARKRLVAGIKVVLDEHQATMAEAVSILIEEAPKRKRIAFEAPVMAAYLEALRAASGAESVAIVAKGARRGNLPDLDDVIGLLRCLDDDVYKGGDTLSEEVLRLILPARD